MRKYFPDFRGIMGNQSGVAFIEMAIVLPVLLVLFYGVTEVTRAVLLTAKLEKSIASITDVVSTFNPTADYPPGTPTPAQAAFDTEITQITKAVPDLISPYDSTSVYIKLSDYYQITSGGTPADDGAAPNRGWTYSCGPALGFTSTPQASAITGGVNIPGIPAQTFNCEDGNIISASAPMCAGEEVLVGEIFYAFTPMFANNGLIGAFTMYKNAYHNPRYNNPSDLSTVLPPPATPSVATCS